jgi:hypothetical protein
MMGTERRGFIRTLTEMEAVQPEEPQATSLARIEVRRVERTRTGEIETLTDLALLGDSLVAIKRASGRTRVGELLVGALEQGFERAFTGGLLFTLRSGLLFGWRGFARGRPAGSMEAVTAVAIPLSAPSILSGPCQGGAAYFGAAPAGGTETDRKLWRFLGAGDPASVGVLPIAVFGQLAAVLYVQADGKLPSWAAPGVTELGMAMASSLERLVQIDQER